MDGAFLRFYVEEGQRHGSVLLWEWLLEKASGQGIRGGSAFRSIGGFGRQQVVHENRFFELPGTTVVEVEFIVTDDESAKLLEIIRNEKVRVFYARVPAHFGVINPDVHDAPSVAVNE